MTPGSDPVPNDITRLEVEALSLFDFIVTLDGYSKKHITSCLTTSLVHLIETLRDSPNIVDKSSQEATRSNLTLVFGLLTQVRQLLQMVSSSDSTSSSQENGETNDPSIAPSRSLASKAMVDWGSLRAWKQTSEPLLNHLTMTLHLFQKTPAKVSTYQELCSKLVHISDSVFTYLREPQSLTSTWQSSLSSVISPTFVVHQLEEELEQRYVSSKIVRRERIVCPSAGLPSETRNLIASHEVRFRCHCRDADHADLLVYSAQPLESLLLQDLSHDNKWLWQIVLFRAGNRVWVRLSDIKHDNHGQLEAFSKRRAAAFITAEHDIGLKTQTSRAATKLEMLGRISQDEMTVLRAKSELSNSTARLLMVHMEFNGKIFRLSDPPPKLGQLLHYDAMSSLLVVKCRNDIDPSTLFAEPYFFVPFNVSTPHKETSYKVQVYHDTDVSILPESPSVRLSNVQCDVLGTSARQLFCSSIDFHFSARNAADQFLESIKKMQLRLLQISLSNPLWQEKVIYQQCDDATQATESNSELCGRQLAVVFSTRNSRYRMIFCQHPEFNAVSFHAEGTLFELTEQEISDYLYSTPIWVVQRVESGRLEHQKVVWADLLSGRHSVKSRALNLNGTMGYRNNEVSPDRWLAHFDDFIAVLKARKKSNEIDEKYKRVKIAILDTGIRGDHRIAHKIVYNDFVKESCASPQDLTGHGTNSIELILKACVDAELFVGRITDSNNTNEIVGPTLMAKGIDWAREQNVEIISISLGFSGTRLGCPTPIRDAIDQAAKAGILIFAAASNWGNKYDIAYPAAIKDQVMCIFASDGANRHVRAFNPDPRDDADNFAILGEDVEITEDCRESGTSVATALAAGVAGRLIDFSRHADSRDGIDNVSLVDTKAGMTAIFKRMSRGRREGYDCMIPWKIVEDSVSIRSKQRAQARSEISLALRKAT